MRMRPHKKNASPKRGDNLPIPIAQNLISPQTRRMEREIGNRALAGGLDVGSHSRALAKAAGESQRGAGTATQSRVSCRM
jgi:hypothetical protein